MVKLEIQKKNGSRNLKIILLLLTILLFVDTVSAWSFASRVRVREHNDITRQALSTYFVDLPGHIVIDPDIRSIQFSDNALDELEKANRQSDKSVDLIHDPVFHFDDENLVESSLLLIDMRQAVVGFAEVGNGELARKILGHAFHLLQDYYSHTNWVELEIVAGAVNSREFATNDGLGFEEHEAPAVGSTCPVFPSVLDDAGKVFMTSGYTEKDICAKVIKNGRFKCTHGSPIPFGCDGLNKDHKDRPHFSPAKDLAIRATRAFVRMIVEDIGNNFSAIGTLLDQDICSLPPNPSFQESVDFCICQLDNPTPDDITECTCAYDIDLGQFCEGD